MDSKILIYILVMAGVTYLIRMLPMVLLRKKITNRFIRSFLYYVPYVTLSAMTVPAIFTASQSVIAAVCAFITAVILAWSGKKLFTVSISACAAVFAVELILRII